MTAIEAVGSARQQSGSNAGPAIAYRPAPYALRTITDSLGTVASETAEIIFAPWRMIPWRSTWVPIMNPGTSARNSSGMLKALQVQMKRAALSAESTNRTPPLTFGWLATIPIARPSSRANPTTTSLAQRSWTSRKESASASASIRSDTSKAAFSSAGTISEIGFAVPGSAGGAAGGASRQLLGMYARYL